MKPREKALHKVQIHRLVTAIADDPELPFHLAFKGGTCARMQGYIERFSVDLDFDLFDSISKEDLRSRFHSVFDEHGFAIKDESNDALQFLLRYEAPETMRNTLKLEALDKVFTANRYEIQAFPEIDRSLNCQTVETIFGNKLVAFTERFETTGKFAARDLYDIQRLFMKGYGWNRELIRERTGKEPKEHFQAFRELIEERLDQKSIDQDLNVLLEKKTFQDLRSSFRSDLLLILQQMIEIEGM